MATNMRLLYFVLLVTLATVCLHLTEGRKLKRCKSVDKDAWGRPLERCFCGYAENRTVCSDGKHCKISEKHPYGYCWEKVKECIITKKFHYGVPNVPCICGKLGFCPDFFACYHMKGDRDESCAKMTITLEEMELEYDY